MTFILMFIKSAFNRLIPFIIEHYKAIAFSLICLYALQQHNALNRVKIDYQAYKSNIAKLAEEQKTKNEQLHKQAEQELADVMATHEESLKVSGLDRKRVEDKLKGSINEISNELNIYRDAISVRNSTSSIDVSKVAENTSGTPNTGTDCNTTLATVIDACKVTDIDYETLYNLYDKQCKIYGCE